jgi:hypothetical protein
MSDDAERPLSLRQADQARWCFGKTPLQTFLDTLPLAKEKLITTI